ncbi:DUF814 domain-containing protein [Candidatus Micrarchaeota archaeon]|nr:DUF814 domain-containing protein [Candidatus Micrarchaeota archaeon]
MDVEIYLDKNVMENATLHYEKAKECRKKAEGIRRGIEDLKKKIEEEKNGIERKEIEQKKKEEKKVRVKEAMKKEWFEVFHWFFTSGGFLVIGGRDAKQNELVVSKRMEKEDLFFHADIQGASAVVMKTGRKIPAEQDKSEAAQFAACYSKAWNRGLGSVDVYCVEGSQVSKTAPSGEFVPKGGFMIYGKREWFRNMELKLVVAKENEKPLVFPANHLKKPKEFVEITPSGESKSSVAKKILKHLNLGGDSIDFLLSILP